MRYILYDIILQILVLALLPYFVLKMITAQKYRKGIPERFGFISGEKLKGLGSGPVVWVHAVSVGETRAVLPVIRLLKERDPRIRVAFSTVTRTGNEVAAKDAAGLVDALFYFPLDLSWVVKRVIRMVRPSAFVVVEKETWPNLFRLLKGSGVPVIVANGTISDRSFRRFVRFKSFFRDIFGSISYFCARTAEDRAKAVGAGVPDERAETVGNVKFDLKPPAPGVDASLEEALTGGASGGVIVAGSTHQGEEEIVLEAFKEVLSELPATRLVLAPRHPERFAAVEALVEKTGLAYSKRSDGGGAGSVVLLDTVGELMPAYGFCSVAFVGGSLVQGIGGHNLLEPAFYARPVVYGPYLTTYLQMAEMLEENGGGVRVIDGRELAERLRALLTDTALREETGRKALEVVTANRGAALRTVEVIESFLGEEFLGKGDQTA